MELSTKLTTKVPQEFVYFDYLEVEITSSGLEIRAQSPLFAKWIKETQVRLSADAKPLIWNSCPQVGPEGATFFTPQPEWEWGKYGCALPKDSTLFYEEKPNLVWLFNTKLAEGSTTVLRRACSLNNWEDYVNSCAKSIQNIYLGELRSACAKMQFSEILPESF